MLYILYNKYIYIYILVIYYHIYVLSKNFILCSHYVLVSCIYFKGLYAIMQKFNSSFRKYKQANFCEY